MDQEILSRNSRRKSREILNENTLVSVLLQRAVTCKWKWTAEIQKRIKPTPSRSDRSIQLSRYVFETFQTLNCYVCRLGVETKLKPLLEQKRLYISFDRGSRWDRRRDIPGRALTLDGRAGENFDVCFMQMMAGEKFYNSIDHENSISRIL